MLKSPSFLQDRTESALPVSSGAQDTPPAMRSMLVEDLWGWRKIGQLVGG
jgi:hypothetical protein